MKTKLARTFYEHRENMPLGCLDELNVVIFSMLWAHTRNFRAGICVQNARPAKCVGVIFLYDCQYIQCVN